VVACIKLAANVLDDASRVHNNFQAHAATALLLPMLWRIARVLSAYRCLRLALVTHKPKPAQ
jgi:hypothetical protein